MKKGNNKYRDESARAAWWNYGWAGAYFITICTEERKHYFGEIENGKIVLSQLGVIADILWYEIPNHHKNVELGAFVIMPNHIHCILILHDKDLKLNPTMEKKQDNKISTEIAGIAGIAGIAIPAIHTVQIILQIVVKNIPGTNIWEITFSESGKKYNFINYRFL